MSDSTLQPFADALDEAYRLMAHGDAFGASNIAEELLADILADWRREPSDEVACRYVAATNCYAASLLAQERPNEAYAALMTALAYTARSKVDPAGLAALAVMAWKIIEGVLNTTAPAKSSAARAQVELLTSALGSLLYDYYYAAGHADPDDPVLPDAYMTLRLIMSLTEIMPDREGHVKLISQLLEASERLGLLQ